MPKNKDRMQQWIDQQSEWQENQYNPGYWVDGRLPRNLLTPRKPKVLGGFILLAGLGLIAGAVLVYASPSSSGGAAGVFENLYALLLAILQGGLGIALAVAGIRKLAKK
jgi:hypothetical protein